MSQSHHATMGCIIISIYTLTLSYIPFPLVPWLQIPSKVWLLGRYCPYKTAACLLEFLSLVYYSSLLHLELIDQFKHFSHWLSNTIHSLKCSNAFPIIEHPIIILIFYQLAFLNIQF